MPYSHSTALVLRAPPPVTVAFARPAVPTCSASSASTFPPRCRGGQSEQYRMRDGARTATLGLAHPLQAVMWGGGGGPAGCWATSLHSFNARGPVRVGSASLSNISVHRSSRARTRSTRPRLRVAAAVSPLLIGALLVVVSSSGPAASCRSFSPRCPPPSNAKGIEWGRANRPALSTKRGRENKNVAAISQRSVD